MEQDPAAAAAAMVALLKAAIPGATQTRYLSVAGLTVMIWDHLLTLHRETQFIWPAPSSYVKWAFFYLRYSTAPMMIVEAHSMSGISGLGLSHHYIVIFATSLGEQFCKPWFVISFVVGMISLITSDVVVLAKVWKLWDGAKHVIHGTILVFALVVSGWIVSIILLIVRNLDDVAYNPALNMCVVTEKPQILKIVWAIAVAFDFFTFLMVTMNALSRPRASRSPLVNILYRDGTVLFLVIIGGSILNLGVAVAAPVFQSILGVFAVWPLTNAIVCRMVLNLAEAELEMQHKEMVEDDDDDQGLDLRPRSRTMDKSLHRLSHHSSHAVRIGRDIELSLM